MYTAVNPFTKRATIEGGKLDFGFFATTEFLNIRSYPEKMNVNNKGARILSTVGPR